MKRPYGSGQIYEKWSRVLSQPGPVTIRFYSMA